MDSLGTIGEIRFFAGAFAPKGWLFCAGQLLQIKDNQALFSILGNRYGGNGHTSFLLPDLRGRVPMGTGPIVVDGQVANFDLAAAGGYPPCR